MNKADEDVNKFILELEQSARKILKDSNKRLKKSAGEFFSYEVSCNHG